MTNNQNIQKPPITDLWLMVDEEQIMRFGMRQAWRWWEAEQPVRYRRANTPAVAHACGAHTPVCCQPAPVACAE